MLPKSNDHCIVLVQYCAMNQEEQINNLTLKEMDDWKFNTKTVHLTLAGYCHAYLQFYLQVTVLLFALNFLVLRPLSCKTHVKLKVYIHSLWA